MELMLLKRPLYIPDPEHEIFNYLRGQEAVRVDRSRYG